jgi:hypothetical protein
MEMMRASFRLAYSLFDKISFFLNHHLQLGHRPKKVAGHCSRRSASIKFYLQRDALFVFDRDAPTSDGLPRVSATERRNLSRAPAQSVREKKTITLVDAPRKSNRNCGAEWTLTSGSSEHEGN